MLSDPQLHYLDNAATSRVDPAVAQAVSEALTELWANPSSLYDPAVAAQDAIAAARARVAKTLHCRSDEIYFTACGSEGNNMAVTGAARPRKHWGNKIVVTGFEHPSVQRPIRALKDEGFTVVEVMPGADGRIDTQKFLAEIDKNTVLAACMAVNNETGAVQDIAALGKGIKARNSRTHFHVDAVQAWLRMPIDLQKWREVDTLSVSGHKVHAPKGVGALFIRDSQRQTLKPPYLGGHQERGLRPGTENTPYIVGLGVAAAQGQQKLRPRIAHIAALNRQLRAGLEELDGITLNSPDDAVGEIVNFSTGCINRQTFINYLNTRAVYVSGGSACDKGEPSHTLLAMGCADLTVRTALRVSFCADNTAEDVDALDVGSVFSTHLDGAVEAQNVTVEKIEKNEENGTVSINGGIEEGGVDLWRSGDIYRTVTYDDYPVYYMMGELVLPVDDSVTLSDSSASVDAVPVETNGAIEVGKAVSEDKGNWTLYNTTVFTKDGVVSNILRIWVP